MIKGIFNTKKWLVLIMIASFALFFSSLFTFYTNDDFFFLKISQANSVRDIFGFFKLTGGPEGFGVYRPLTTQAFYFLGKIFFNLDPIPLHILSFITFFSLIYLVYELAYVLSKSGYVGLLAAFLYAVSATHFAHLNYLATFQELGLALFFVISVVLFIKFVKQKNMKAYIFSLASFGAAILSKETAVVLPFVLFLIYGFIKVNKESALKTKNLILSLLPFFLILFFYLYMRVFYYGFASGESYIWDVSIRVINTLAWYGLWSLNLPEMLVDFVGPGLRFNPKLFKFWGSQIVPIFVMFGGLTLLTLALVISSFKKNLKRKDLSIYIISFLWFIFTLIPVLFLPLHKFTFYLTLPLFGVVLAIAYALKRNAFNKPFVILFLSLWSLLSIVTLNLTYKTHWISQGAKTAKRAFDYFNKYYSDTSEKVFVEFYDTEEDNDLPWSPTEVLKVTLSNNNFFEVFFDEKITLYSGRDNAPETKIVKLRARQFLNY